MKQFSNIVVPFLIFLCATTVVAQDDQPRSDRWGGMVLNVSTPDDAIRLFGTPSKDKDKVALDVPRPLSWLSVKCKEKLFRTITYKRIQEYKQVQFSFLGGKLVSISMEAPNAELEDKWIDPDDLEQLFGVVFKPNRRRYNSQLPPPSDVAVHWLGSAFVEVPTRARSTFRSCSALGVVSTVTKRCRPVSAL